MPSHSARQGAPHSVYVNHSYARSWSPRQLERWIGSLFFERLANHRDPKEALALARRGQEVAKPPAYLNSGLKIAIVVHVHRVLDAALAAL